MLDSFKTAPKAIYAGLVTGLASLGALLVNDTEFEDITAGQWVFVVSSALIAFGGVYGLKNAPPS